MRLPLPRPHQRACTAVRPRAGARAWQMVWLACLLLALVFVPTLGRVHQALHSGDHRAVPIYGLAHAGHAADAAHPHASAQAAPAAAALIESLLPAHTSGVDCLLLDQRWPWPMVCWPLRRACPPSPAPTTPRWAWCSTGGCCIGRCSRPAHLPQPCGPESPR
ncbi:hypothetical protein [Acidovorax temperans]